MTNKAIFITVRTGSTRLKNKSILKIKDKHTIEYVIDAAKKSKYAKDIILCTSTNPNDKILCDIAEKNNIKWFRGSEENKLKLICLGKLYCCVGQYKAAAHTVP